jgi:hypothetical protein
VPAILAEAAHPALDQSEISLRNRRLEGDRMAADSKTSSGEVRKLPFQQSGHTATDGRASPKAPING